MKNLLYIFFISVLFFSCKNSADNKMSFAQVGNNAGSNDMGTNVLCKDICYEGVRVPFEYSVDNNGNYVWFKNLSTQEFINDVPDFGTDCPPLSCTTESLGICADGNYTGINDGDELIVVLEKCSDGTNTIQSIALLSNPTASIPVPIGMVFKPCNNDIETELISCITDEDAVSWNEILINGTILAYQNKSTKLFGSPSGSVDNWTGCESDNEIVATWSERHCILVDGNEFEAVINVNSDKSICATTTDGNSMYKQGEFSIVPCCGETSSSSRHLAGFTVQRPTDTPNTGWNNQLINAAPALSGDFKLCFTPESETDNTAQMIGLSLNPNSNSSFTNIDCAIYFYNGNATYLMREYRSGTQANILPSTSWVGQEVCFERIGSDVFISQNGVVLNQSNPCPVGTGTLFLDDSHYFAAGFWGTGSITYSDFELRSSSSLKITSVNDCIEEEENNILTQLLNKVELADVIICDYLGLGEVEIRYYSDGSKEVFNILTGIEIDPFVPASIICIGSGGSVSLSKDFRTTTDNFIVTGVNNNGGFSGTQSGTETALTAIVSAGSGQNNGLGNRYTVTWANAHPLGTSYRAFFTAVGNITNASPNGLSPHILSKTSTSITYGLYSGDDGQGDDDFDRFQHDLVVTGESYLLLEDVTLN